MNNQPWIEISGLRLGLYPRRTLDVVLLAEYSREHDSEIDRLYQVTYIVRDGLKPNLTDCKWWQLIRKFRIKKLLSLQYLMKLYNLSELNTIASIILKLEGVEVDAIQDEKAVKKKKKTSQITG